MSMAITAVPAARPAVALGIIRIVLGTILAVHGAQKLFVFGFAGVAGAFTQMGIPLAEVAGPVVALVEFFGGLALVMGLMTRLSATAIAANMLGALLLVHLPNGFFLPSGVEFVLMLFASAVAIAITGPGALSVDSLLRRRRTAHG